MADDERGFEQAFRSNLLPAQRREILATLRATLKRETTLGQIIDAAESLGWGEAMGDLRLADLARSLLLGEQGGAPASSAGGRSSSATDDAGDRHDESVAFSQAGIDYRPGDIDEDEGLEALDDTDGSDVFAGDLVAELAPPTRKGASKSSRAPALFLGDGWERSRGADASPPKAKAKSGSVKATEKEPAAPTQIRGAGAAPRGSAQKKVSKTVAETATKAAKSKTTAAAQKPKKAAAARPAPSKSATATAKKATAKKASAKKSSAKPSSRR